MSFEIAAPSLPAKANGLGWMHGTMMISAELEGIHFTDAYASCHAIKMKWYLVDRI